LLVIAVVLVTVGSSCEEAAEDGNDTVASSTSGDASIAIVEPADGAIVASDEITIRGSAPAGSKVRRDRTGPDETINVDDDGSWEYKAELDEGENEFSFHLDGQDEITSAVTIVLDPNAVSGSAVTPALVASTTRETPTESDPTSTPKVADTPSPSQTSVPTNTPEPTASPTMPPPPTLEPTLTPVPPTSTPVPPPAPIVVTGAGQTLTDPITLEQGLGIFTMKHDGGSNFAIWFHDQSTGERLELLVNEIGSWAGSHAIEIPKSGSYIFDVAADGNWEISVLQPEPTNSLVFQSPYEISGSGSQAVYFVQLSSGLHKVTMTHDGSSNFAIWAFNADASQRSLLVNEIGSFDGSTGLQIGNGGSYVVFDITADGNWTIRVE
jgi:hypothetical protein